MDSAYAQPGDPAQPQSTRGVAEEIALVRDIVRALTDAEELPVERLRVLAELRRQLSVLHALVRTERAGKDKGDNAIELISAALRASGYYSQLASLEDAGPTDGDEEEPVDGGFTPWRPPS